MVSSDQLLEPLSAAYSIIGRADFINARQMAHNACVLLDTAQSYIRPTAQSDDAFIHTKMLIQQFADQIAGQFGAGADPQSSIENARGIAVLAIQQLHIDLADARPSELAKDLGLAW